VGRRAPGTFWGAFISLASIRCNPWSALPRGCQGSA